MSKSQKYKEDYKEEDKFVALLIADSFNSKFEPISLNTSTVLMPLVNKPLIDYTLECLDYSGVQEVIIFCSNKSYQIRDYLNKSKWIELKSMKISFIVSENCFSIGDALRDIDNKSLIRKDFVLIYGEVVSNINLKEIFESHKKKKIEFKNSVMTVLFKESVPSHITRNEENYVFLAVNKKTNQIVHYQKVATRKKISLPLNHLELDVIKLHFDLLNSHIFICSPIVLQLMSDNFDYQTMDDFIRGILINEEILGNSIFLHVLNGNEYATRVTSLQMYEAVSKDVINRWTYPFVPDCKSACTYNLNNIYHSYNFSKKYQCSLVRNVVIGDNSVIGEGSYLQDTVIGNNCKIGKNVTLNNSYLWDNVTIKDGCKITSSLLDRNVLINENVIIQPKCLLGEGVEITSNKIIGSYTKLISNCLDGNCNLSSYGSNCFLYLAKSGDMVNQICKLGCWEEISNHDLLYEDSESSSEDEEVEDINEANMFYKEVLSNLERAYNENISAKNVILEINSVKHAFGIQIQEVTMMLSKALLEIPSIIISANLNTESYFTKYKILMKMFLPLLQNYVKSEQSEKDVLMAMEELSEVNETIMKNIALVIKYLYDEDILSETCILKWWTNQDKMHSIEIKNKLNGLIDWLKNAEEEEDDNED